MEENNQSVVTTSNNVGFTQVIESQKIEGQTVPMNEVPVKPYVFRKLCAKDIPTMLKLLKKVQINKFTNCFQSEQVQNLIKGLNDENKTEDMDLLVGGAVILEIAQIIIDGIAESGDEIFKLLSDTSNLSIEEVEALDFDVFTQMVIDFVKKEEFMGFIKAVLPSIK